MTAARVQPSRTALIVFSLAGLIAAAWLSTLLVMAGGLYMGLMAKSIIGELQAIYVNHNKR